MNENGNQSTAEEQSGIAGAAAGFIAHLLELRDRLLRIVLAIGIGFLVLMPFAKDLYNFLSNPLVSQLPDGNKLIAVAVTSPFLIPYKLALLVAFLIALPYIFYQLWGFIAPALYKHEKRLVIPLLTSSVLLFYLGMAFAFFVVLPLMFGILPGFAPDNVDVTPDIGQYLDFVMMIFIAFGIGFEMPIATIILISTGITTREELAKKRPYVIVGAFLVGMLLTPPDVLSQILLAFPMWLLFELGLVASQLFKKQIKIAGEEKEEKEKHDREDDDKRYAAVVTATGASAGAAAATTSIAAENDTTEEANTTQTESESSDSMLWEDDNYLFEEDNTSYDREYHASNPEEDEPPLANDLPEDDYRPMTDAEMDAELDLMEEDDDEPNTPSMTKTEESSIEDSNKGNN